MPLRNVRLVLLLATVCLLTSSLLAQEVKGTVTDPSGAVIAGANVQVKVDGKSIAEALTDHKGTYFLRVKPPVQSGKEGTLTISASGFRTETKNIQFDSTKLAALNVELTIATPDEQVSVNAKSQGFSEQLDMSEVRDSPARDVGEALTQIDGVWKTRRAGIANDLVVRGLQQNNINVLVDGSRTYGACPGHMDPPAQHVDFSEVERVEVLKGPYDVANQGSLGAIINVVTKTPGLGLHVRPGASFASSGFFNPSVTASYGNDTFKVLMGYSYRVSDPYTDGSGRKFTSYANYKPEAQSRRSFDINSGWLQADYTPRKNQIFSLSYTRQMSGLILYPYLTMDADYDRADRAILKYNAKDLSGTVRAVRIETYFTQVQHYMSDRLRKSALPTGWKMASDAYTRVAGGRIESDLGRDFTIGADSYYRNWNMYGYMNAAGMGVQVSPSIPDVNTLTLGAFVDYKHSLTDALKLMGGMRFDFSRMTATEGTFTSDLAYYYHDVRRKANQDAYLSGNLRLTAALGKQTELFMGVGTTGRTPDAEERYINRKTLMGANMGNPNLPMTRNVETDAGFTFTRGRAYIKPSLFFSNFNDFIIVNEQPRLNAPPAGVMLPMSARSYQNIGAHIYGGEISYAFAFAKVLSVTGGGSLQKGSGERKPQFGVLDTNLPEMPPVRTWAALRYTRGMGFAEIGGTAAARQELVNRDLNESPTAGYGTMNTKVGFTYKRWYATFMVDNLLDRYYYEHLSYYRDPDNAGIKIPEPGRNFFAQVKFAF